MTDSVQVSEEMKKQVDLAFDLVYGLSAIGLACGLLAGGASYLMQEMSKKDSPCPREIKSSQPMNKPPTSTKLSLG